jgi:DNA-binding MarR family transcriptional regulator
MTVRLNRLQAAGLIERQPNPHDGRGVLVYLTPAGKELAEDALTTVLQAQTEIVGSLEPSDRNQLSQLLRSFLTRLGDIPAFSPTVVVKRKT